MKKLIIAILLLSATAWSAGPEIFFGVYHGATCATTIPSSSNTRLTVEYDTAANIGSDAGRYYIGQIISSSGNHTVCKVAWKIDSITGDVSGVTLYSQIWTMSGNNLNTLVAESATTFTGTGTGTKEFVFNANFSSSAYAVVITMKSTGSAYYSIAMNTSDVDNGYSNYARWSNAKEYQTGYASYDLVGQFYE